MSMSQLPRTAAVVLTTALLLGACSDSGAPEVDDLAASSPTAEATVTPEAGSEPSQAPSPDVSAEPSPAPSPSPCPAGQQRIAPGSDCFEPSPAAEPSPEPEPEPEPTQEQTQQPEPAGPCDGRDARGYSVTAVNFDFSKDSITDVCSGDTVTLTVEEGSHSFTVNGAEGDTGVFGSGESRTTTVSGAPGTYTFKCTLHPNQMSGQIELIG